MQPFCPNIPTNTLLLAPPPPSLFILFAQHLSDLQAQLEQTFSFYAQSSEFYQIFPLFLGFLFALVSLLCYHLIQKVYFFLFYVPSMLVQEPSSTPALLENQDQNEETKHEEQTPAELLPNLNTNTVQCLLSMRKSPMKSNSHAFSRRMTTLCYSSDSQRPSFELVESSKPGSKLTTPLTSSQKMKFSDDSSL